jgi:hypothetical protein
MEADKKTIRVFLHGVVAHLSRAMTIVSTEALNKPITKTPATLRGLYLMGNQGILEMFYLPKYQTNGWRRFVTRVTRAVDRYSGHVVGIDFLLAAAAWSDEVILRLEMGSLSVVVDHYRPVPFDTTSKLYEFRLYVMMVPTQQKPGPLITSASLHAAIQGRDRQAVEDTIKAGVDVNSIFAYSVLTKALCDVITSQSVASAAASISVFNLIASQPDVDWDLRATDGDTILQQILFIDVCSVQHLLPWDKIDLYACNDLGDNILHSCCRHVSDTRMSIHMTNILQSPFEANDVVRDRIATLVKLLLRLGAQGLALCTNDDGKRASELCDWPSLRTLLVKAETDAAHIVSTCLSHVIEIDTLVHIVMSYYTAFL